MSKSYETQMKEVIIRMMAYNVDRKLIISLVIIGIHQSLLKINTTFPCLVLELTLQEMGFL